MYEEKIAKRLVQAEEYASKLTAANVPDKDYQGYIRLYLQTAHDVQMEMEAQRRNTIYQNKSK